MTRRLNLLKSRNVLALSAAAAFLFPSVGCSSATPGGGSTGGAVNTGGTVSTGGVVTTGGARSGGASSGGATTGGASTGGATTGGAATGGSASGGGNSGGAPAGGSPAGGAATGGSAAGGGSPAGGSGGGGGGDFKLTSAEVTDGMPIPEAHTCDGGGGQMNWGVAPSFKWENPPEGTMSYAFFMIDWTLTMKNPPDVLGYHSAAWNIPTTVTELDLGWGMADLPGAKIINGGYLGPCPPSGTDTYHMIVLALPMASYTISGSASQGVKTAWDMLKGVALATAEIKGTYMQK
jgi:phosphatidylethanolamine-binding protein (PEBP) family uncharacterized protein